MKRRRFLKLTGALGMSVAAALAGCAAPASIPPTAMPTASPTLAAPTTTPTALPTPTDVPTATLEPTKAPPPTEAPTNTPEPTRAPTPTVEAAPTRMSEEEARKLANSINIIDVDTADLKLIRDRLVTLSQKTPLRLTVNDFDQEFRDYWEKTWVKKYPQLTLEYILKNFDPNPLRVVADGNLKNISKAPSSAFWMADKAISSTKGRAAFSDWNIHPTGFLANNNEVWAEFTLYKELSAVQLVALAKKTVGSQGNLKFEEMQVFIENITFALQVDYIKRYGDVSNDAHMADYVRDLKIASTNMNPLTLNPTTK